MDLHGGAHCSSSALAVLPAGRLLTLTTLTFRAGATLGNATTASRASSTLRARLGGRGGWVTGAAG